MGLELHETDASVRASLSTRLNCYNAELKRLKQEFQNAKGNSESNAHDYSDFDDYSNGMTSDQRRHLLDNSERIERTGNMLTEGARSILETEQLGTAVLQDLSAQRESIHKTRSRVSCTDLICYTGTSLIDFTFFISFQLREADEDLRQSSRIMNSMIMRSLRERAVLITIVIMFVIVVIFSIYHMFN